MVSVLGFVELRARCAAHSRLWYERARGMFPHARNYSRPGISWKRVILAENWPLGFF